MMLIMMSMFTPGVCSTTPGVVEVLHATHSVPHRVWWMHHTGCGIPVLNRIFSVCLDDNGHFSAFKFIATTAART